LSVLAVGSVSGSANSDEFIVTIGGIPLEHFPGVDVENICGPYTPWHPPVSLEAVRELSTLILEFAEKYCLPDDATTRIIEVAKRQSAASIPASIAFFKLELADRSDHVSVERSGIQQIGDCQY
jgi:hypothetical protein